ncbi:transporter substrate-binding domain-containing protein [Paraglaciecola aquimarina]|uniref:Transporter substrate-binding domain-containing protein n=1 Tax=Paraglaciecola algarum TaxID=3050085 RepID=A0ABS9D698_9ALTE|nr:transporter substrate-binding domain-containing protein [Paraglaciecola sp. G1-23]MCF2947957.1 transporter substrate-binding domain-containing protein [Paraglaciecola sp. G1-23]
MTRLLMTEFLIKILVVLSCFTNVCSAKEYHFVSIQNLVEQEVGRLVLPQVYRKLGITISITPLPGNRAQAQAKSGQSDGEIMRIYNYGIETPTTLRVPTPYYSLETMAFVRKDSGINITEKDNLKKYKVVRVRGVKHTNNITEGLENVIDLDSTEQMMRLLARGMVDVALTNTIDGLIAIRKLNIDNVKAIDKPLARLDLFHYIHQDHKELVSQIDRVLREMKHSGELAVIIDIAEKEIISPSLR